MRENNDMEAWEYASIEELSMNSRSFIETLNNAGARGWEVVALTDTDPIVGPNTLVGIVKRRIVPFDAPEQLEEAWKIDPSDRHQARYWDGECWTFRVSNNGDESRDPPTRLSPAQRMQ